MKASQSLQGTIRSGCFELRYSIEGEGIPAIVIGSAVYYPRTFSKRLRESLKFVFVDHRGFARADGETPVMEFALEHILSDIELIRQRLGLGRIVVIGHSGHGYMAMEYAKRFPDHVSHVIMIGTGPSHSPEHMRLSEQYWEEAVCPERKHKLESDLQILAGEVAADPERRFIHFCIRLGAKSWYDHAFDASSLWKDVQVNMPMFDYMWGEVFRDIDITKGLESFDKPVFLALGRFDYLVAPYSSWAPYREKFRHLTTRVFDRSGHTPQMEESELFDMELLRWLGILG